LRMSSWRLPSSCVFSFMVFLIFSSGRLGVGTPWSRGYRHSSAMTCLCC
jgi:hypothetical protein